MPIFGLFNKELDNQYLHSGPIVDLYEKYRTDQYSAYDGVPTVYYDIYLHGTKQRVGKCDLRLKMDERMYYYGHVGYNISFEFRGHHYAREACKILFKIAKNEFNYKELIITCNPDNVASYKTLRSLGGQLREVAEIPHNHELFNIGDTYKCVFLYRFDLDDGKDK